MRFASILFVCMPLFAAPGFAQGSDTCASAQAIAGTGLFAFDNSTATTDGAPTAICYFFGTDQIENDVWFEWTAPSTATFTLATCAITTVDTKLAVYDGGCAASAIACNDDACGLQSSVDFAANQNQTYTLRLGTFPGASGGTGMFDLTENVPPSIIATMVNPQNGHTYHLLDGSSWTLAEQTAVALGGHLTTVEDAAENQWLWDNFHTFGNEDRDLWIGYNDVAIEGLFEWVDGSPVGYENWDLNEPSNGGGGEHFAAIRKNSANGEWNDLADAPVGFHANPNGVVELGGGAGVDYCFGDGSGTLCPCGNNGQSGQGCANGTGQGAVLSASGTLSVAAADLVLNGENLPANQPGLFFQADNAISGGVLFGDGLRCAGGSVIRLQVASAGVSGTSSTSIDLVDKGGVSAGETKRYQLWYRDPAGSPCGFDFNLSQGLELVWTP